MTETTQSLIDDIAEMLKPLVAHIEAQPALTMHRYDKYMLGIQQVAETTGIAKFKDPLRSRAYVLLGKSFVRAGASMRGVESALMIMGHQ